MPNHQLLSNIAKSQKSKGICKSKTLTELTKMQMQNYPVKPSISSKALVQIRISVINLKDNR